MAGGLYFPLGEGSYMMELNIKYYLFVSDANGIVDWESMFDSGHQQKYVLSTYTGMSPDPSEWPVGGKIYTPMPTTRPTSKSTTPRPTTNSVTANPINMPRTREPTAGPATRIPTNERLFDRSLTATHIAMHTIGNATVATPMDTPITTRTASGGHGLQ